MRIASFPALALLGFLVLGLSTAHAQDWEADPTYGNVELSEGFLPDPHEITLTAGGSVEPTVATTRPECGYGHIAEAPDYDLYYETTGGTTLYVYAVAGSDTMILINAPDQTWLCDDDSYGEGDPLVIIPNAAAGLYDIWVGTYGEETVEATLFISEVDPRTSE